MRGKISKLLAVLLTGCMLVSMLSMSAFAATYYTITATLRDENDTTKSVTRTSGQLSASSPFVSSIVNIAPTRAELAETFAGSGLGGVYDAVLAAYQASGSAIETSYSGQVSANPAEALRVFMDKTTTVSDFLSSAGTTATLTYDHYTFTVTVSTQTTSDPTTTTGGGGDSGYSDSEAAAVAAASGGRSSGGGSSSGGSSSGGSDSSDTITTETVAATVEATVQDNVAVVESVTVNESSISDSDADAVTVTIDVSDLDVPTVELPVESFQSITDALEEHGGEENSILIQTANGSVALDIDAALAVSDQIEGADLTLTVEETGLDSLNEAQSGALANVDAATSFEVSMTSRGQTVDLRGGTARVSVPFTPQPGRRGSDYNVFFCGLNGALERMVTSFIGNALSFRTGHFSTYVVVYEEPSNPFIDVNASNWYYNAVTFVNRRGLMNGMGSNVFSPDTKATRAQMVTILWNMENQPYSGTSIGFSDVQPNDWYYNAIRWGVSAGVVSGESDGWFAAAKSISRQEMAMMLYNYAKYKNQSVTVYGNTLGGFTDTGSISDWAQTAMNWACSERIINGMGDGTVNPGGDATRAMVATVLMNYINR